MQFLHLIPALFASLAIAQSTSTTSSTATATVAAGTDGYTYAGCYNETTGVTGTGGARALAGGKMSANSTATVTSCIEYCAASNFNYAGLQYGDECWCSAYLNALSAKLNESSCDIACAGNDTQLCGGSLTISLYNTSASSSSKQSSAGTMVGAQWSVVGACVLAAVVAVVL